MNNTIQVICNILNTNAGRDMMSDLRMYLWDGFAMHNVRDWYIDKIGGPGMDDQSVDWFTVRDAIHPVVKDLDCKFGEFGTIVWE